jgi:hypothetical protein
MEEALRFLRAYELWVYLLLGLGGMFYVRKFILAWGELRGAAFGLERESAQARLNQAASVLVLLLVVAVIMFVLVSFIAPAIPGAVPLLTPTLDLLATPTTTLLSVTQEPGEPILTPTATILPGGTPPGNGCIPGQIMITFPDDGSEVRDVTDVIGTANTPNFGFYKLEMKRSEETNWLTILAGNEPKTDEILGTWNTGLLAPGNHELSLVVIDNQGESSAPCIIQVRVSSTEETPST